MLIGLACSKDDKKPSSENSKLPPLKPSARETVITSMNSSLLVWNYAELEYLKKKRELASAKMIHTANGIADTTETQSARSVLPNPIMEYTKSKKCQVQLLNDEDEINRNKRSESYQYAIKIDGDNCPLTVRIEKSASIIGTEEKGGAQISGNILWSFLIKDQDLKNLVKLDSLTVNFPYSGIVSKSGKLVKINLDMRMEGVGTTYDKETLKQQGSFKIESEFNEEFYKGDIGTGHRNGKVIAKEEIEISLGNEAEYLKGDFKFQYGMPTLEDQFFVNQEKTSFESYKKLRSKIILPIGNLFQTGFGLINAPPVDLADPVCKKTHLCTATVYSAQTVSKTDVENAILKKSPITAPVLKESKACGRPVIDSVVVGTDRLNLNFKYSSQGTNVEISNATANMNSYDRFVGLGESIDDAAEIGVFTLRIKCEAQRGGF